MILKNGDVIAEFFPQFELSSSDNPDFQEGFEPYFFQGKTVNSLRIENCDKFAHAISSSAQQLCEYLLEEANLLTGSHLRLLTQEGENPRIILLHEHTEHPYLEIVISENKPKEVYELDTSGNRANQILTLNDVTLSEKSGLIQEPQKYKILKDLTTQTIFFKFSDTGLIFILREGRLFSKEYKDYMLAEDQKSLTLNAPFHMIISHGDSLKLIRPFGILLFNRSIKWEVSDKERMDIDRLKQELEKRGSQGEMSPYFSYELTQDRSSLQSSSREAMLHLCFSYMRNQDFLSTNQILETYDYAMPMSKQFKLAQGIYFSALGNIETHMMFNSPHAYSTFLKWIFLVEQSHLFESNPIEDTDLSLKKYLPHILQQYIQALAAHQIDQDCMLSAYQLHTLLEESDNQAFDPIRKIVGNPAHWGHQAKFVFEGANYTPTIKKPLAPHTIISARVSALDSVLSVCPTETIYTRYFNHAIHQKSERIVEPQKSGNNLFQVRMAQKAADINLYQEQPLKLHSLKSEFELSRVLVDLQTLSEETKLIKDELLQELKEKLSHSGPLSRQKRDILLAIKSGKEHQPVLEDLFLPFLTQNSTLYSNLIPGITASEIKTIEVLFTRFLDTAIVLNHINNILAQPKNTLTPQKLGEALAKQRAYENNSPLNRAALVHEYRMGFYFHDNQLEAATALKTQKNLIKELRTGAGKTSVIAELIALSQMSEGALTLVVPAILEKGTFDVLQKALKPLKIKPHFFHFQREWLKAQTEEEELKLYKKMADYLTQVQQSKGILVISGSTANSVIAKIAELTDISLSKPSPLTTQLLDQVLNMHEIIQQTKIVEDEYDEVNSLKNEFNYAYKRPEPIRGELVTTTTELLDIWYKNPDITGLIQASPKGVFEETVLPNGHTYFKLIDKESAYFKNTILNHYIDILVKQLEETYGYLISEKAFSQAGYTQAQLKLYLKGGQKDPKENKILEALIAQLGTKNIDLGNILVHSKDFFTEAFPHILTQSPETDFAPLSIPPLASNQLVRPRSQGVSKGDNTQFQSQSMSLATTAHFYKLLGIEKPALHYYLQ